MDPPRPTSFSGRRRSSVFTTEDNTAVSPTTPAPRKASTWDSTPAPSGDRTASDISGRRASATVGDSGAPAREFSGAGSIAGRKASAWDDPPTAAGGGGSGASDIAGRRATAVDRSPWDAFAGAPPRDGGSTWGWMSEIARMSSGFGGSISERNRVFFTGNINYIFETHNDKNVEIADFEAIMYAYGVDETSVKDIVKKIDPQKHGRFTINSHNKQIILNSTINFSQPNDPLNNLRHASKCFHKNLLSPLPFAAYIIGILQGRYLGEKPRFMILGMYSIFGVLQGTPNRLLTTKDVETFIGLWKLLSPNEAQDLIDLIKYDFNGTIDCVDFYNALYVRNWLGKQRVQMFDVFGPQNPSLFFTLMDKDEDGFLSSVDLRSFAAIFGRQPSDEAVRRVIRKLDVDGDGKINREDFSKAMRPVFDGLSWEFWLVAILLTLEL